MKCLILAAGQGRRMSTRGEIKPLVPLLGIPLIERVIKTVKDFVDEIYVVTGYKEEKVKEFLKELSKRENIKISTISNPDWDKENGFSVLKAKDVIKEPFLLVMGDHLFDSSIIKELLNTKIKEDEVILAVDTFLENPYVNPEDVTKVRIDERGYILDIGKRIKEYNCYDTGIFLCTPKIFWAIEESIKRHNDYTLSGGIRILSEKGLARSFDIKKRFWIDVDDPWALKKAEDGILGQIKNKASDGPVSRYLNRPISIKISKILVNYPITPNQISVFSFFLSILSFLCFFYGNSYFWLLLGGILTQFSSIIDGCDGEIARLKFLKSDFGGWFDAVLDRYADGIILFGLSWYGYKTLNNPFLFFIGFWAIIGSYALSYTADKYDNLMIKKLKKGKYFRIGRDVRLFLVFLFCLLNKVKIGLIFIALIMNLETIRRVWFFYRDEKRR